MKRNGWTILLAGITLCTVSFISAWLLSPAFVPAKLAETVAEATAPTVVEPFTDRQKVQVSFKLSPEQPLYAVRTGRIRDSACSPASTIDSGDQLLRIDDTPVFALATRTPFFRDIEPGATGDDVLQLQEELIRLGYSVEANAVFDWQTIAAINRFFTDREAKETDNMLETSRFVWIPRPTVAFESCDLAVGAVLDDGSSFATLTPLLLSIDVAEPKGTSLEGARTITILDVTAPLPLDGSTFDAATLESIATVRGFNTVAMDGEPVDALTELVDPPAVLKVPTAALFAVDNRNACLQSSKSTYAVSILASSAGSTYVTLPEDAPTTVYTSDSISATSC